MATIDKIKTNGTTYDIAVNGANVSGAVASAGTLTGLTATVTELNYCDGVTSNIQTQINNLGKSVAEGKSTLATTLSNNGVSTASDASFATISTNIDAVATNKYNDGVSDTKVGTATESDVLSGYTFTNSNGVGISGTMPMRGTTSVATGCGRKNNQGVVYLPFGYYHPYSSKNSNGQVLVPSSYAKDLANSLNVGYDAGVDDTKVGTATAAQVLTGYTFTNASSVGVSGTMPANSLGTAVAAVGSDSTGPYAHIPYGFYQNNTSNNGYSYVRFTKDLAKTLANSAGVGYNAGASAVTQEMNAGKALLATTISSYGYASPTTNDTFEELSDAISDSIYLAQSSSGTSSPIRVGTFSTGKSNEITLYNLDPNYSYAYVFFAGETPRGYVVNEGYCVRGYTSELESHGPDTCWDEGTMEYSSDGKTLKLTWADDTYTDDDPGIIILSQERFSVPSGGGNSVAYFY